jgi:Na+/proline symporter
MASLFWDAILKNMNWFIFWIFIYLVVIAWFAFRHVKMGDIDNYLVNNRNTATLPLVFTTLATFVGGGTSIGLIAMGYESGFTASACQRIKILQGLFLPWSVE